MSKPALMREERQGRFARAGHRTMGFLLYTAGRQEQRHDPSDVSDAHIFPSPPPPSQGSFIPLENFRGG